MGLLRFLLAISVVFSHAGQFLGFSFVGGQTAVEAFFIISGFYITLILNEKYIDVNNSYKLFITNRFLRLYPLYWTVLLLTIAFDFLIPHFEAKATMGTLREWRANGSSLSITSCLFLIGTNLLLFFQDAVMFLRMATNGALSFGPNFWTAKLSPYQFLLVPQAWSIGLELIFYLIAPFIVRKRYVLIALLIIISMIAKIYWTTHGLDYDPWTYRFFPFELVYFLLGSVGYFAYKYIIKHINLPQYFYKALYIVVALLTIFFSFLNIDHKFLLYTAVIFLAVPFLFKYTSQFKIDRFVGELSYPIYLSHVLILNLVRAIGVTRHENVFTIVGSIVFSIFLVKVIGDKIEKIRQARVKKQRGLNNGADVLSVKFTSHL